MGLAFTEINGDGAQARRRIRNAAQLLINYLVTKEGQQSSQRHLGAVIKNVPDTFYVEPRQQNLLALTPRKVTEFQHFWNELFKKSGSEGAGLWPAPFTLPADEGVTACPA